MRDGCVVWSWTVHLIQYVSLIRIKCFHCHILLFNDALLLLDKIATWVHNCLGVLVLRLLDRRGYILLKHNGFETATLVIWRWSRSVLIQGRCLMIVSTWWRRVPLLLRWQLWRCQYSCLRLGRCSQGAVDFINTTIAIWLLLLGGPLVAGQHFDYRGRKRRRCLLTWQDCIISLLLQVLRCLINVHVGVYETGDWSTTSLVALLSRTRNTTWCGLRESHRKGVTHFYLFYCLFTILLDVISSWSNLFYSPS